MIGMLRAKEANADILVAGFLIVAFLFLLAPHQAATQELPNLHKATADKVLPDVQPYLSSGSASAIADLRSFGPRLLRTGLPA